MEYSRSVSMDLSAPSLSLSSLSIPEVSSIEDMSDDKIAVIVPKMMSPATVLPKPPSNELLPLRLPNAASQPSRTVLVALIKKVMAEFIGTFLLVFTLLSALIANDEARGGGKLGLVGVAAAAGLAVVVIVLSVVHVSGSHLNPAVSVGMAVFGYLPSAHLLPYVAAQFAGSIGASFAAVTIYDGPSSSNVVVVTTVPMVGAVQAFFVEFVTTFVLLFLITALATDPKAVKELIAVGAGAAVTMNALISAESTGASMNPARTLGPAIATGTYTKIWVYMVAPPLGAIAGTGAYVALK